MSDMWFLLCIVLVGSINRTLYCAERKWRCWGVFFVTFYPFWIPLKDNNTMFFIKRDAKKDARTCIPHWLRTCGSKNSRRRPLWWWARWPPTLQPPALSWWFWPLWSPAFPFEFSTVESAMQKTDSIRVKRDALFARVPIVKKRPSSF